MRGNRRTDLTSNIEHSIVYLLFSIHHHHHVVPLARISLTLSRHFSQLFIASGRSSGLHPVSSHCCCMYVRAGRPPFARPYVGVHKSISLMSSSLLLQQCPKFILLRARKYMETDNGHCLLCGFVCLSLF